MWRGAKHRCPCLSLLCFQRMLKLKDDAWPRFFFFLVHCFKIESVLGFFTMVEFAVV